MSDENDGDAAYPAVNEDDAFEFDIEPIYDRVLVRQDAEREEIGNTGLIAAEEHREKPLRGTVVSVGEGRLLETGVRVPLLVRPGDRVIFTRYAGLEIPEDLGHGPRLKMMREDEVMAIERARLKAPLTFREVTLPGDVFRTMLVPGA
jgi:chaperonin GroES